MRRVAFVLFVLALGLPLLACTQKDECEACSSDADCRPGFVCSNFDDGGRRCGSGLGSTGCPTRR
jgi:hypothetical protein